MQIDLAALVRNAGTFRRKSFVAPRIEPTAAQGGDLLRIYMRVVRGWQQRFRETILPEYERALSELITDDAATLNTTMGVSERQMAQLAAAAGLSIDEWISTTEAWHRKRFAQAFNPTGVKIGTLLDRPDVAPTLAAVLGENTALIRSLDDQMRNGISGAVFRALQARTPARDLAREVRQIAGVGQSRAELIAADQLQKLTGALDEQRQKQAGIEKFEWAHSRKAKPRPEHVVRDGKVYAWTDPVAKTDPPGRAIRCGCRARAVLEIDEQVETTAAPTPAPAPAPKAPPPPPPPPPPAPPPARRFRSPINPAVTAETVVVEPRLAVQKRLRAEFARADADPRYDRTNDFTGKPADFGTATFSTDFSDNAASLIAAIKPELDDLADQIGVPRLRGFKPTKAASASMGDGVMNLNPGTFGRYADKVGDVSGGLGQRAALQAQMAPLIERIKAAREQMAAVGMNTPEWSAAFDAEKVAFGQYQKLRDADDRLWRAGVGRTEQRVASDWLPEKGLAGRPGGSHEFFDDGISQARSLVFHEFGHHVHQYLKREGPRRQFGTPPLERDLTTHYRQAMADKSVTTPTKYATTNPKEWFAENFALYVMGRRDLVDKYADALITKVFEHDF